MEISWHRYGGTRTILNESPYKTMFSLNADDLSFICGLVLYMYKILKLKLERFWSIILVVYRKGVPHWTLKRMIPYGRRHWRRQQFSCSVGLPLVLAHPEELLLNWRTAVNRITGELDDPCHVGYLRITGICRVNQHSITARPCWNSVRKVMYFCAAFWDRVKAVLAHAICSWLGWPMVSGSSQTQCQMTSVIGTERDRQASWRCCTFTSSSNFCPVPVTHRLDGRGRNPRNKLYLAWVLTSHIRPYKSYGVRSKFVQT